MNDRFGVDHDVDLLRGKTKKPASLDDFKALVHQRGGIYGDPAAHLPYRMLQRKFGSNGLQVPSRCLEEGSARPGQDQPSNFPMFARPQALVDRAVFAVDGKHLHAAFTRDAGNQFASHYHYLLVGQPYRLPRTDSLIYGHKTGGAM